MTHFEIGSGDPSPRYTPQFRLEGDDEDMARRFKWKQDSWVDHDQGRTTDEQYEQEVEQGPPPVWRPGDLIDDERWTPDDRNKGNQ